MPQGFPQQHHHHQFINESGAFPSFVAPSTFENNFIPVFKTQAELEAEIEANEFKKPAKNLSEFFAAADYEVKPQKLGKKARKLANANKNREEKASLVQEH